MTFLNNEQLLVSFGNILLNRCINKDDKINIQKQLFITRTHSNSSAIDITTAIGYAEINIKDDGIYYTPKIFDHCSYFVDVVELFQRDVLHVCGSGNSTELHSIDYFYLSMHPKTENARIIVTECNLNS